MTRPRDWYLNNVSVIEPVKYAVSVVTSVEGPTMTYDQRKARTKPFIAWDGEGIDLDGRGKPQAYCLFGASTRDYKLSKTGLSTKECFQLMLRVRYKNPGAIHVGFGFGYDAEMMFRDVPHDILKAIMQGNVRWWGRYRIQYFNKKWIQITGPYRGSRYTCRIYDIWSFFGCSFLDALETFLPDTNEHTMRRIREGKLARGAFTVDQLATVVVPYWQEELICEVKMIEKLRVLLHKAELYPAKWHGPSNLAVYLNIKHGIKHHMNRDAPELVKDASQFAYAAGRVENYMVGRLNGPAWKYDRNSAYPSAMVDLPSLAGARWRGRTFDDWENNAESDFRLLGIRPFAMYYVDYEHYAYRGLREGMTDPQPFFHRTKQANIMFPPATKRWVWGVELINVIAMNQFSEDRPIVRVYRGIELEDESTERPYAFVQDLYDKRRQMKEDGLEEEIAIKLALNNLYGKMAQQKGWRDGEKLPPWVQFDWAGFVTAHNRAHMWHMAMVAAKRGILISIETDAIFTSAPMPELEPGSKELGKWGKEQYDDIICLQSGVYMTFHKGACKRRECNGWHLKYRGFDRDSVRPDNILKYLDTTSLYHFDPQRYEEQPLIGSTTRFVGFKLASTRAFGIEDDWRVWKTEPREIVVGNSGKRWHNPQFCRACQDGVYYGSERMHDMSQKFYENTETVSHATKLPWRTVKGEADKWLPEDELDFDIDGIDGEDIVL